MSLLLFAMSTASTTLATPCDTNNAQSASWEFAGPSTYVTRGDPLNISSAGAIQDVAVSRSGSNGKPVWFVGSVNGGVWSTSTLSNAVPTWTNVLDGQPVTCSSIAALHVSSFDPKRIYAGCGGSTSSEQGSDWNVLNSGDWGGVMQSKDQGATWSMTSFPTNYYVTSILELDTGDLLVSAQSDLWNASDGGIWRGQTPSSSSSSSSSASASSSSSSSQRTWVKVSELPTFTLIVLPMNEGVPGGYIATHARLPQQSVSLSLDRGNTWMKLGELPWKIDAIPFYTCATVVGNTLVVAGLTSQKTNVSDTDSAIFTRSLPVRVTTPWLLLPQPTSMDEDAMPKDRMAVLGDPDVDDLMYVAGNAGALAWRVNITTQVWTKLWDKPDVLDGSEAHGDCRNYAWDHDGENGGRLVLVSDGGIFTRESPRKPGGKWLSLNGDIKTMEFLSAHYDNRDDRFVAGAQDNCAQVFSSNANSLAVGFVDGDGTVTLVDNVHSPSRLYGTTQFMGVGTIDIDPSDAGERRNNRTEQNEDKIKDKDGDDDDDCGGLCFVQGDAFIGVPLDKYFPEPSSFPFFVQPYALNTQDPTQLVFWANGTSTRKSAFYAFTIAATVMTKDDIPAPKMMVESPPGSFFLDFISGGYTNKVSDPELLIGMDNVNLYVRNKDTGGVLTTRPLPATFAIPVTLAYDETNNGARILGPLSHGSTVSMAVSPSDSNVIAVTGWQSIKTNIAAEDVWLTTDAGASKDNWVNATGNMRSASGVVGKVRPGGLLVIDLLANNDRALLVSTTNGVLISSMSKIGDWSRFGSCNQFPIVLTASLSYEHYSDTLVAATFGRGVYKLHNAKAEILKALAQRGNIHNVSWVQEESSAKYFPAQQASKHAQHASKHA